MNVSLTQLKFTKLTPPLFLSLANLRSVGRYTGECVTSEKDASRNVCMIEGWCPIEDDILPLKNNAPIFTEIENFTVLIKNTIRFPLFNIPKRNIDENKETAAGMVYLICAH